jgi:hypothetical protein
VFNTTTFEKPESASPGKGPLVDVLTHLGNARMDAPPASVERLALIAVSDGMVARADVR